MRRWQSEINFKSLNEMNLYGGATGSSRRD